MLGRFLVQLVPAREKGCRIAGTELYAVVATVSLLAQRGLQLPQHPGNDVWLREPQFRKAAHRRKIA